MPSRVETELKYDVSQPGAADRYLELTVIAGFFADGGLRTEAIDDRYVDTHSLALARSGWAARFRRAGAAGHEHSGPRLELKSRERMVGLHRRRELDGDADPDAAPDTWPASRARDLVVRACASDGPLETLVSIRQVRRVRTFRNDSAAAELSLDAVEVFDGDTALDAFETVEVELIAGGERALRAFREVLDSDPWMCPSSDSKLERALRALAERLGETAETERLAAIRSMLAPEAPDAVEAKPDKREAKVDKREAKPDKGEAKVDKREAKPGDGQAKPDKREPAEPDDRKPPASDKHAAAPGGHEAAEPDHREQAHTVAAIAGTDSLGEATLRILRAQLERIVEREPGVRSGRDPEDVHRMRVATRRARALLRLFDDVFEKKTERRLERSLRGLARRLGGVRDLDVLLDALDAYAAALPPDEAIGIEPIRSAWRRDRERARTALAAELESDDYRDLAKALDRLTRHPDLVRLPPGNAPTVRDRAGSAVFAALEQVQSFEQTLAWADIETLHRLRIAAKRLRYTIEFFEPALGAEAPALVERVVRLQDHLGGLHDADVAAGLARKLLAESHGSMSAAEASAIAAYLRSREREVARLRRSLRGVYRTVAGATFRRALARSVGRL